MSRIKSLLPDLIILQYGLNIVKNVKENYSYYEKGLARQLSLIKNLSPHSSILVVGVTDMAANEGDSIKSYNNIPFIIDAQKQATTKAGVFFWDSYKAMGGKSSIIRWAGMKPPLAQKDYVHFTYQGADTLSEASRSLIIYLSSDRFSLIKTGEDHSSGASRYNTGTYQKQVCLSLWFIHY